MNLIIGKTYRMKTRSEMEALDDGADGIYYGLDPDMLDFCGKEIKLGSFSEMGDISLSEIWFELVEPSDSLIPSDYMWTDQWLVEIKQVRNITKLYREY